MKENRIERLEKENEPLYQELYTLMKLKWYRKAYRFLTRECNRFIPSTRYNKYKNVLELKLQGKRG